MLRNLPWILVGYPMTVPAGAPAGGKAAAGATAPDTALKMKKEPAPAGRASSATRTAPATDAALVPDRGDGWGFRPFASMIGYKGD